MASSQLQDELPRQSYADYEAESYQGSTATLLEKSDASLHNPHHAPRWTWNTILLVANLSWTLIGTYLLALQPIIRQTHNGEDLEIFGHIPHQEVEFLSDGDDQAKNRTAEWEALHNSFAGFVNIKDAQKHGLKGGYPFPPDNATGEIYCISAFHQLHCLAGIKAALEAPPSRRRDLAREKHMEHCFPYLRQAIMCSADLTLEKTVWSIGEMDVFGATGWGNTHQCRSWDAVLAFSKDHRHGVKGFNEVEDGV